MENGHGFLEFSVPWLKFYMRNWSGHPCLVVVANPNVAGVLIIKAEKCTRTDIACTVTYRASKI